MSQTIGLHLSAAVAALLLGILVLVQAKGTYRHKLMGRFWVVLMFTVAITSLWIRDLNGGAFSGIHLLTALTVLSLIRGIRAIRKGYVEAHKRFMIGTFIGLCGAGLGTLLPGRLIPTFLANLL